MMTVELTGGLHDRDERHRVGVREIPEVEGDLTTGSIENIHTRAPFTRGYDREYVPKIVNGKRTFVHKDSPEVIVWVDQDRDQDNRN